MEFIDVTAKTIDAAIADGVARLEARGLSVDKTEVLTQPSNGFLGIGRKQAVVRLYYTSPAAPNESTLSSMDAQEDTSCTSVDIAEENSSTSAEMPAVERTISTGRKTFSKKVQQAAAETGTAFLHDLFANMNLPVAIEKRTTEEAIYYDVHGDNVGILIGKHGQTLDAITYLTGLVANKEAGSHFRVIVDVENYRARREETLKALAHRLAHKTKTYRESIKLEPMNGYERKIIHLALQDDPHVTTDSEGEGSFRHVVIKYKA